MCRLLEDTPSPLPARPYSNPGISCRIRGEAGVRVGPRQPAYSNLGLVERIRGEAGGYVDLHEPPKANPGRIYMLGEAGGAGGGGCHRQQAPIRA